MKKFLIGLTVVVVATFSLQLVGNAYRYELYDMAIQFESEQAKLAAKTVSVNGEEFAYLESPKKAGQETIIMLHGFGASKENWLRFAAYFSENYHVIALDLAGHGDNKADMQRAYGVADQVSYVHEIANALQLDKFHLVGNSMGGAISSLYAATYPEQVLRVVLISPAGIHDVPSDLERALDQNDGHNPLIAKSEDEFEDLLDFVMEAKPYIPGPIVKVEAEKAVKRVAINQRIFSFLRADLEKGLAENLTKIQAPVLIIWGDHDRAIDVANIEKYAHLIPHAETLVLEDIGHLAMVEVPKVSAQAMLSFIEQPSS